MNELKQQVTNHNRK